MLLTSGQISMGISSGVVFVFTSLLFISGYVLQQQTVRNLQAAIRPLHPPPTLALNKSRMVSKQFGNPRGSSTYDKFLASNRPKGGWAKVAYVQLLRERTHVCTAVMLFAELERQESMAQRIIVYPQEWHLQQANEGGSGSHVETSLRLLENAAKRYKVELQPVDRMQESLEEEAAYPLLGLLSLTIFDRLLYLRPSGLILDSAKLDLLFTFPTESSILGISKSPEEEDTIPSIVILEPSMKAYNDTLSSTPAGSYSDNEFLRNILQVPTTADQTHLVAKTSAIALENDQFSAAEFFDSTSYVQLSDPEFPGPEFDIPRKQALQARPKKLQHRKAWETVYEIFRQQRMSICGLDLEPFPVVGSKEETAIDTESQKERSRITRT